MGLETGEPETKPVDLSLPSKSTRPVLNWGICEVLREYGEYVLDFAERETKTSIVLIKYSIYYN